MSGGPAHAQCCWGWLVHVCVCHCTGTGKGGQSIWGGRFEDEFHDSLKVCSSVSAS